MKVKLRAVFLLIGCIAVAMQANAESGDLSYDEIIDSIEGQVPELVTTGRIEALDLGARTGTIGGFRYHFGPSTISLPMQVKMLGRDFGSVQLLSVGMDVQVYYFMAPTEHRVATEIIQIEESEQH